MGYFIDKPTTHTAKMVNSPKKPSSPKPAKRAAKKEKKEKKERRRSKKGKLVKKSDFSSYKSFIHKLLKHQSEKTQITSRAMGVVDAFTKDIFQRIAEEAGKATRFSGAKTLR